MAHELVSRVSIIDQIPVREYLMAYCGEAGWHGLGKQFTPSSFEEAVQYCGFDREVVIEDVFTSSGFRLPDCRAVKDSDGRYLGTVGPEYTAHQDRDLVNLARSYIETGLVSFDTAGMLLGGSRIWISLKVNDSEVEIAPGDSIKTNLFLAQGHDSTLAVVQGYSDTRIVCNNTLGVALRDGSNALQKRTKHRSSVVSSAQDAQKVILGLLEGQRKRVDAYKLLAATNVDGAGVKAFLETVIGSEESEPATRVKLKFLSGIGNKGRTWWDLFNAVTEDVTHGLGYKKEGDQGGEREGRALNKMFFGAGAKLNADAFKSALFLAQKQASGGSQALALVG